MSSKRLVLLGAVLFLLAAVPLTVFYTQKQTETQSHANPTTKLSFDPPTVPTAVDQTFNVDVKVDPGTNQVSFIKLRITYDQTKLATSGSAFTPNSSVVTTLEDAVYTPGVITIGLGMTVSQGTGVDASKTIQTIQKIGTITFKALADTGSTNTPIKIDDDQTQVLSARTDQDLQGENVLQRPSGQSLVTIGPGTSPTATPAPQAANVAPVCDSLNIDRTATGSAPFSITFTGNGRDSDGTITKATFNFGDGPVQDVTQAGGIGTNTVSAQIAHTYSNSGTYQASVIFTDNRGGVSNSSINCTKTITVSGPAIGGAGQVATPTSTLAPTEAVVITATPTIAPTGPGNTVLGIGALGAILSIAGALLFFAL